MKKSILVACFMVAAFAGTAFADTVEDCEARCSQQLKACMAEAVKFVNDIEVQDAKAACESASTSCNGECVSAEQEHRFDAPPKEGEEKQQ